MEVYTFNLRYSEGGDQEVDLGPPNPRMVLSLDSYFIPFSKMLFQILFTGAGDWALGYLFGDTVQPAMVAIG
jgi:hypothetical protein